MDRYSELKALVTVVDTGSFSAAADRLDVAKSAVSRRVSELEQRLGVRLLTRTTRRLNLTDAGRALHERAISLLADWDEAEQAVSAQGTALSGRLRIATPLTFGLRHLGPVVTEFARDHPEVELEVDLGDREVDLVDEVFDMAIRIGRLEDSSLIARRLSDIPLLSVASPDYLDRHGTPESPEALKDHLAMRYTLVRRNVWQFTDANGHARSGRPKTALAANNGEHLMEACIQGLGLASLPVFIVHDAIRDGRLIPVLTAFHREPAGLYLVYPPGRLRSRRVRVFSDHIVRHFQGGAPWQGCPGIDEH